MSGGTTKALFSRDLKWGRSHVGIRTKSVPNRNSQRKGPEVELCLEQSERTRGRVGGKELIMRDLVGHGRTLASGFSYLVKIFFC